MNSATDYSEIPFRQLIEALLDTESHLHPRFLYRLSDLEPEELEQLKLSWQQVPLWRRQSLMKDLEQLGSVNNLLSFEAIGRHAVEDADPQVRNLAVKILWEFEANDLVPIFLNLVESDTDIEVRASATSALGRFVYLGEVDKLSHKTQRTVEDHLIHWIESNEPDEIRRRALESIGYSSRSEVPGLIEKAYTSGEREWIESALLAMGRSVDERWENQVMEMLDSKYPSLRAEAARAAGELELKEAIPRLLELLDDSDEDVRKATIWSLSQIGGEGVREAFEELLAQAGADDEIDLLESALDNLSFTEDFQLFSLFDFSEEDIESEILDLMGEEDYLEFDTDDDDEDI